MKSINMDLVFYDNYTFSFYINSGEYKTFIDGFYGLA